MKRDHAFVLMSGGFDSTAIAMYYKTNGFEVHPVKINYNSRQIEPENIALDLIVDELDLDPIIRVNLDLVNHSSLSKEVSPNMVESGEYKDFTSVSTVVPGRNFSFIAALNNVAESFVCANREVEKAIIAIGVHSSDWLMYPDCRPDFISAIGEAVSKSSSGKISLKTPGLRLTKNQLPRIIFNERIGDIYSQNYIVKVLGLSYSCYRGGAIHCGTCPTCRERHEAFMSFAGCDPTEYENNPENK